jgi:hypothetical protein
MPKEKTMSDHRRVLRIRVTHQANDEKVNLTMPLGLARLMRIGAVADQLSKKYGVNVDDILDDIEETPDGKIIDVVDEKSGDHVEIYIETRGTADAEMSDASRVASR